MKTLFKIFTIISLAFLSSCDLFDSDNDPKLPPVTMDGRNTFGCLVNGRVWLPKGQSGSNGVFVDMTIQNFLSISADNEIDNTGMSLVLNDNKNFEINKTYTLSNSNIYYATYNYRMGHGICFYEYQHIVSGKVLFSKLETQLISGTFEFITYNPDCGDTVKVKEGRFDIGNISH